MGVLLLAPAWAAPAPIVVPMNQSQSVLNFELCIADSCSSDSSSVAGSVTIGLDDYQQPSQIWLYDFDLQLAESLHWSISWGFLGSFTADATGAALTYAYPGTPLGPGAIVGDQFTLLDVPANAEGTLTYHASGVPCWALEGASMPCDDTRDLSEGGTQVADEFAGTVTVQDYVVTLSTSLDLMVPLIPEQPDVATLHVWGTVRGQAELPPPALGDMNDDGAVNNFDIAPFVFALTHTEAEFLAQYPGGCYACADVNDDGDVNNFDIGPFVALLTDK
jgi:hypothetical protein